MLGREVQAEALQCYLLHVQGVEELVLHFYVGFAGVGSDAAAQLQEIAAVGLQVAAAYKNHGAQRSCLVNLQFDCAAVAAGGGGIGLHFEAGKGRGPG